MVKKSTYPLFALTGKCVSEPYPLPSCTSRNYSKEIDMGMLKDSFTVTIII
jgi:hypothetical protein